MITLTGFADEISPDLDTQLDTLTAEGISYLELRSVWKTNVLKLSDAQVERIKQQLDSRGIQVSSIGSPIGKIKITDDFEPHLLDFQRAIALARFFETPYIRIFSFLIPSGESPDHYKEEVLLRMKELVRIAEQEHVILLHENEKHIYGDTGERCRVLLEACQSSHFRCAFDPANYIQCRVRPMTEAHPLVDDYISYIHIKDALLETGKVVPAGEGDGQLAELLANLRDRKYEGFLSLEPHLAADGKYQGYSGAELFKVASNAIKGMLQQAGMEWK
ncbi:sugar phosphate isomerase/epimerase family protein [Paenibacillus sp. GCM10023248]|uniref:sugar phosphate isomerase/epimerase family protein n=1 Tax=Bacillales TaxID=1385 RepID=UPI00237814FB|nr:MULTISPECIES: sugar phosphate isomerase/epimerase family protein [Bacillales]MDD9265561.1 sugar phosphate isomerase/epimerase [Paenibacillus sp. MAHUQ-63]MDR6878796.1 sugar phosphate isomerase/epimerase [Bacillus sp. 3255]